MLARLVIRYRDTILDVAHLRTGQRFTIGSSPAASLLVSHASLPDVDVVELVRVTNEGARVTDPRCGTQALLRAGDVARLELGEVSLHVSLTPAESPQLERRAVDWGLIASIATTGAFAVVLALLMRRTPALEPLDPSPSEPAYARYLVRPPADAPAKPSEPPTPPPPQIVHCGDEKLGAGASARPSRDSAGRAGRKVRRQQARSSAPKTDLDHAGLLAVMASEMSLYDGQHFAIAVGNDDEDVWGSLDSSTLATAYDGEGGLGLVGTGRGGGGGGEGTIGLGNTGLIGRGGWGGVSTGCPVCRRSASKPRIRAERARVEGALDGSIIHRVTKAKINQLQACYDDALRRAPKLKGELDLQYVIAPEGTVSTVLVEQSPDRALGECMTKVFRRSRFPKSSTSGTIVHQPITLDPR